MEQTNSVIEKNVVPKTQSFYLPELDILRFFAFFAVLFYHCFPNDAESYQGKLAPFALWIKSAVVAGSFGVDLFFALSSFLITELLIREEEKKGKINAPAFYMRRALRIFPLYFTFVLLAIFVFPLFFKTEPLFFPYNAAFLLFIGNWACAVFGFPKTFANQLWSVSIEEQFYIVFPFLLMFLGVKRLKFLAISFLIIATITRIILTINGTDYFGFWCNTFVRLDSIAAGILLALFLRNGQLPLIEKTSIRVILCIFGIFLCIAASRYLNFFGYQALFAYPILALASSLIIWSVLNPNKINPERHKIMIHLGRISYGLYVIHMLCIALADMILDKFAITGIPWATLRLILSLIFSIILAAISYEFLEKPFLKLKKHFTFVESRPL